MHADDAGQQPVDLAQAVDEPGDGDDLAAVVVEEGLGAVEPLRGQEDVAAEPFGQRATAEMADSEAEVVADDGGEASRRANTAAMFMLPAPAKTAAAAISMISPGTGTPKSSRNSIPPTAR